LPCRQEYGLSINTTRINSRTILSIVRHSELVRSSASKTINPCRPLALKSLLARSSNLPNCSGSCFTHSTDSFQEPRGTASDIAADSPYPARTSTFERSAPDCPRRCRISSEPSAALQKLLPTPRDPITRLHSKRKALTWDGGT